MSVRVHATALANCRVSIQRGAVVGENYGVDLDPQRSFVVLEDDGNMEAWVFTDLTMPQQEELVRVVKRVRDRIR